MQNTYIPEVLRGQFCYEDREAHAQRMSRASCLLFAHGTDQIRMITDKIYGPGGRC